MYFSHLDNLAEKSLEFHALTLYNERKRFKLLCNEEIKHENKKEKAVLFFKVGLVRIREGSELGSLPYFGPKHKSTKV